MRGRDDGRDTMCNGYQWSDQTGAAVNPTTLANATTVYLGWRDDTAGGGDIRVARRVPS